MHDPRSRQPASREVRLALVACLAAASASTALFGAPALEVDARLAARVAARIVADQVRFDYAHALAMAERAKEVGLVEDSRVRDAVADAERGQLAWDAIRGGAEIWVQRKRSVRFSPNDALVTTAPDADTKAASARVTGIAGRVVTVLPRGRNATPFEADVLALAPEELLLLAKAGAEKGDVERLPVAITALQLYVRGPTAARRTFDAYELEDDEDAEAILERLGTVGARCRRPNSRPSNAR